MLETNEMKASCIKKRELLIFAASGGYDSPNRTTLKIYDALTEAMKTGTPYQTRLNPPPADPRCCHPSKDAIR